MYKLLKKPFFGRFMGPWRNPLSELQRAEWQPLTVSSRSGATLRGLFAAARTPAAKATLVLGHPMGKEAKGFFLKHGYADLLRDHGYHVVVFDFNGFGESGVGNFSYHEDMVAVGRVAAERVSDLPVGYLGISLGGQWATVAFADARHPYQFAIVESAPTTLEEFWVRFPLAYRTLQLIAFVSPAFARSVRIVERIKEARGVQSLLFIYSATDDWAPVAMGQRFQRNSPVPAELWTVAQGKHAQLMKSPHQAAYQAKILAYFDHAVASARP